MTSDFNPSADKKTLRDEFAGRAMSTLLSWRWYEFNELASESYKLAQVMLEEREKYEKS